MTVTSIFGLAGFFFAVVVGLAVAVGAGFFGAAAGAGGGVGAGLAGVTALGLFPAAAIAKLAALDPLVTTGLGVAVGDAAATEGGVLAATPPGGAVQFATGIQRVGS